MQKVKLPVVTPDLEFADTTNLASLQARVKAGDLIQIAPRIYTAKKDVAPAELVRRNWYAVCAFYFGGAVISHRTALELKPTEGGDVYITANVRRTRYLPGLTIRAIPGHGPLENDMAMMGVSASSRPRALLENLSCTTKSGVVTWTLARAEMESKLVQWVQRKAGCRHREYETRSHRKSVGCIRL